MYMLIDVKPLEGHGQNSAECLIQFFWKIYYFNLEFKEHTFFLTKQSHHHLIKWTKEYHFLKFIRFRTLKDSRSRVLAEISPHIRVRWQHLIKWWLFKFSIVQVSSRTDSYIIDLLATIWITSGFKLIPIIYFIRGLYGTIG